MLLLHRIKIISFLALILSSQAWALTYKDLHGVDSILRRECVEFSLSHGFKGVESGLLADVRFAGSFGPKHKDYPCHRQIREENQDKDCPQDWTSALIQQLFPSPATTTLTANQGSKDDPLSLNHKMSSNVLEALGAVLENIYLKQQLQQSQSQQLGQKAVQQIITEDEVLEIFYEKIFAGHEREKKQKELEKIERLKAIKEKARSSLGEPNCSNRDGALPSLKEVPHFSGNSSGNSSGDPGSKFEKIAQPFVFAGRNKTWWNELEKLAKSLVGSLRENSQPGAIYPSSITKDALLGYIWQKARSKEEVEPFLKGMAACQDRDGFEKWKVTPPYAAGNYRNWLAGVQNGKLTPEQILELAQSPERASFYANAVEIYDRPEAPILPFQRAAHESLGENKTSYRRFNTYSDCGESLIRHFFENFTYREIPGLEGEHVFDVALLEEAIQKHHLKPYHNNAPANSDLELDFGLIPFFKNFFDPLQSNTSQVRDAWSRRVASGLPGAEGFYAKNASCDIQGGIDAILKVVEVLVGDPEWPSLEVEDIDADTGQITRVVRFESEEKLRIAKLDRLCRIFSREGHQLSWKPSGNSAITNLNANIEFLVNNKPLFAWTIEKTHSSLRSLLPAKLSWRHEVGHSLLAMIENEAKTQSRVHSLVRALPQALHETLPWFIDENLIASDPPIFPRVEFIWGSSVRNPDDGKSKSIIMKRLADEHEDLKKPIPTRLFPVLKKWMNFSFTGDRIYQTYVLNLLEELGPEVAQLFKSERKNAEGVLLKDMPKTLLLAARFGLNHTLKWAVQKKTPLNSKFEGQSAVHYAAEGGHLKTLQLLLSIAPPKFWEDPEFLQARGVSPLYYAVWSGNIKVVSAVIDGHSDHFWSNPKFKYLPILKLALIKNYTDIAELIFKRFYGNSEVRKRDLLESVKAADVKRVKFFLDHGVADDNDTDEAYRGSLIIAVYKTPEGKQDGLLEVLSTGRVRPLSKLHLAAGTGNLERVKTLLTETKAQEINHLSFGHSALHFAARKKSLAVMQELIKHKIDVNEAQTQGLTALMIASQNGYTEGVKFLLEHHADSTRVDSEDWTALHKAASHGHLNIVQMLVSANANLEAINDQGLTPLDYAECNKHLDVVDFLLRAGAEPYIPKVSTSIGDHE